MYDMPYLDRLRSSVIAYFTVQREGKSFRCSQLVNHSNVFHELSSHEFLDQYKIEVAFPISYKLILHKERTTPTSIKTILQLIFKIKLLESFYPVSVGYPTGWKYMWNLIWRVRWKLSIIRIKLLANLQVAKYTDTKNASVLFLLLESLLLQEYMHFQLINFALQLYLKTTHVFD